MNAARAFKTHQTLKRRGHALCPVCDSNGEEHFLHKGKCIKCLSSKQRRVVVPFVDTAAYYFLKTGKELPQIEAMSEEEFDRFVETGTILVKGEL